MGRLTALPENTRQGWKGLPVTNSLTYLLGVSVIKTEVFYQLNKKNKCYETF
jgi:hypothetical protein